MNTKKIFIIALVVLVVLAGGLITYNLLKGDPTNQTGDDGSLPASRDTGLPSSGNNNTLTGSGNLNNSSASVAAMKIKPISKEKAFSPALGEDGKTVKYFARSNGNLWESDFDGMNLKKISSVALKDFIKLIWSPNKEKVIGIFTENNKTKKYFYNYSNGQSAILNEKIGYIGWSPDSKKIAYQFTDAATGQSNISVSNPDGTSWKNVFKTRLDNVIVEWPLATKISLRTPASGLSQGILYAINSSTGDFNKILSEYNGLSVKWSPSADKILFSATNQQGKKPYLAVADEKGTNTKDLKLSGIAEKCAWGKDNKTIYCALPQEISENAIWPDDYYKGMVIVADDFYRINLETGEKTKITGSGEFGYDAQDLFLSPKEDYLFFINKRDGLLYSIKL